MTLTFRLKMSVPIENFIIKKRVLCFDKLFLEVINTFFLLKLSLTDRFRLPWYSTNSPPCKIGALLVPKLLPIFFYFTLVLPIGLVETIISCERKWDWEEECFLFCLIQTSLHLNQEPTFTFWIIFAFPKHYMLQKVITWNIRSMIKKK